MGAAERLGGRPGPRRVFETVVDGDIVLRTDGRAYRGGVLYQVELAPEPELNPGLFAEDLSAEVMLLEEVDAERTTSHHAACE